MDAFADFLAFMSGAPAILGLFLAALIIFLSSDPRLSLAALLLQYILAGLALTRFIRPEITVVKIMVGVLAVLILYLGVRNINQEPAAEDRDKGGIQFLGLTLGWDAGPLGLPLRVFSVLLTVLALVRLFSVYRLPLVANDIAFVAIWMGSMGILGLILGGGPLRIAPALLTILASFDLVYAKLEPSLAIVGLFGALTLMTALAFSYLGVVQSLGTSPEGPEQKGTEL